MVKKIIINMATGWWMMSLVAEAHHPEKKTKEVLIQALRQHLQAAEKLLQKLALSTQDSGTQASPSPSHKIFSDAPHFPPSPPQLLNEPSDHQTPAHFPLGESKNITTAPPKNCTQDIDPKNHQKFLYEKALDLLLKGAHEQSITVLKNLLQNYPQTFYSEDAHYWLAVARLHGGQVQLGLKNMENFLVAYPQSHRVPDVLIKIYKSFLVSGQEGAALTILERLVKNFSKHPRHVEFQQEYQKLQESRTAKREGFQSS